ncbi:uncharacterized protein LOC110728780 [Chenopodium quinoa]|uniref:uncharacterized protein LOC110728780 n=1 Tax=Chenopodium quinoa TaxID=63459 RepID=UPI000B78D086|nr:uncharacterized protein LOC110728780 [Chenopodium quinoa]
MEVPYDFDDVNVGFQENDVGQGHVPHTAQQHQAEAAPATPVVPSHARRPLAESTSPTAQPAGNPTCAGLGESSGTAGSGHGQGGQQHSSTLSTTATPSQPHTDAGPDQSSTQHMGKGMREKFLSVLLRDYVTHTIIANSPSSPSSNTPSPRHPSDVSSGKEPRSFKEAMKDAGWRRSMQTEIQAVEKNKTWTMEDLLPSRQPLGSQWVYKINYNSDGSIE